MEKVLYTYAMAKTLYEKGNDYLDTFVPFIIKILSINEEPSLSEQQIKNILKEKYNLDIPDHVILELCRRGVVNGYLEKSSKTKFTINSKGMELAKSLEEEREAERRSNALAESLSNYLKAKEYGEFSIEQSIDLLLSFVNQNLVAVAIFMDSPLYRPQIERGNYISKGIIDFIVKIEKSKPDEFSTLTDILRGSVMCALVQARTEQVPKTLKKVDVFLDSNTVFSILGYNQDEVNRSCQELHKLLLREKCNLYVFNFTITEMISVLNGCKRNGDAWLPNPKVDSIYSRMASKTTAEITEIIGNIEDILAEKDIKVYETGIRLSNSDMGINATKLATYKTDAIQRTLNHDMLALNAIINIRNGQDKRKLEKCKAIFVTSDMKLVKYDLVEHQHNERGTIAEVISDSLLTQILWVNFPHDSKVPLYSAISIHSKALLIDKDVWRRFTQILKSMREDNKITTEDISLLIYSKNTEDILIKEEEPSALSEDFIMTQIQRARAKIDKEKEDIVQTKDQEIIKKEIELALAAKNQSAITAKLDAVLENIDNIARNKATSTIQFYWKLVGLGVIAFLGIQVYIFNKFNFNMWTYISPIVSILGLLGLRFPLKNYMDKKNSKLVSMYSKELRKKFLNEGLDEMSTSLKS